MWSFRKISSETFQDMKPHRIRFYNTRRSPHKIHKCALHRLCFKIFTDAWYFDFLKTLRTPNQVKSAIPTQPNLKTWIRIQIHYFWRIQHKSVNNFREFEHHRITVFQYMSHKGVNYYTTTTHEKQHFHKNETKQRQQKQ